MFNMEKFANLLSGKRREKGLSQGQLADLVGVTHQAVSKWERGEAMPEISKIGDIAKAVEVPADELINTLYENESAPAPNVQFCNADEEYFALKDKTRVGDIYALAPKLSKETLHSAIDMLVQAKGAGSASMLYQFADKEYLASLANRLFAIGDTSLAEYVDESTLKASIVDCITNADICFDNNVRASHYDKAGKLLAYCKDVQFVDDMFEHMTVFLGGRWDIWRNYIGKFPSEVLVKQGIKIAVSQGPNCFNSWWDIIGRRNIAKIFIGYIENFEKNNYRAWEDISRFYGYADGAIMESAIKERLADSEIDPQIFKPLLRYLTPDLRNALAKRGVRDGAQNGNNNNNFRGNRRNNSSMDDMIESMIMGKIAEALDDSDWDEIPAILSGVTKLRSTMGNNSGGSDEMLVSIMEKLEEISSKLEELESRIDDLEGEIGEIGDIGEE